MATRRATNMRMANNQRSWDRAQQPRQQSDAKEQLYTLRLVAKNDRAPMTDYSYSDYANDTGGKNYHSVQGAYRRSDADELAKRYSNSPLNRDYRAEVQKMDMSNTGAYQSRWMADRWHDNMNSVFENDVRRVMNAYSDADRPQPSGGTTTNSH